MGGRKHAGGGAGIRSESAKSIIVDFYYRGVRCRERLKLAPTPGNQRFVSNLRARIQDDIARGTFDYASYFPDSKKAVAMAKAPGAAVFVRDALRQYLSGRRSELEHTTFGDYEKAIENEWIPYLGDLRLVEVTRGVLKEWVAQKGAGIKRIRNLLLPLRGMFAQTFDDGIIPMNPFVGWTPKKISPPKEEDDVDPFSQAEVNLILENSVGQVRNLFQFCFWTGLRTSEVIALRWDDVDLKGRTMTIRRAKVRKQEKAPKTRAGRRTVTLLQPAYDALVAQRQHTQLAGLEIFLNPRTGAPWEHDGPIRKTAWQPALKRAGVRYRYPYQTRHTFASTLLSAGENPVWVATMMGHKDWAMIIKVYGRWIPSIAPDAGDKVAALWSVSSPKIAQVVDP
jgi:integrase